MNTPPEPQPRAIDLEYAELSAAVYDPGKQQVGRWTRVMDPDLTTLRAGSRPGAEADPTSGFKAAAFTDGQRHVLAFAGSEAQASDWLTNLGQSLGLSTSQYGQAETFAKLCKAAYGKDLTMTGHSLGGGLATIASAVTGCEAVTFNPAGLHDKTLRRASVNPDKFRDAAEQGLVRKYVVRGEILDRMQRILPVPDAPGQRIDLEADRNTFSKHRIGVVIEGLEARLADRGDASGARAQRQAANKAMADTFRQQDAREGLKQHPGLENAYGVLRVMEAKAATMGEQEGRRFRQLARADLAARIERGDKIPPVPAKEPAEPARPSAPAHGPTRPAERER